jgi:hypothetical protein
LVFAVLWYEFPVDSKVEDGLTELLDLVGAGGDAREMADEELGVTAKGFCIRSVVQAMVGGRCEPIPSAFSLALRRL